MFSQSILRKRKFRENETIEHCEMRHANDREGKQMKKSIEIPEQYKTRLIRDREQKHNKRKRHVLGNIDECINRSDEIWNQNIIDQQLSESDRKLL